MSRVIEHDPSQPSPLPREAQQLSKLAWLLDSSIPIPGTNFRVGIDALIGLIPGLGDLIGVFLSGYIVREAWRLGAPKSMLARMSFNVVVEGVVGAVPLLGDLFDAAWKANQRNVRLLQAHYADPHKTRRSSRFFLAGMIGVFMLLIVFIGAVGAGIWAMLQGALGA